MRKGGIYFFHIPKTAGLSVWSFLEEAFDEERICPWWLWDQLITAPAADLDRWDVFRGHFLAHLESYLGRELATFTMLRDPVERTISHYYHVRRAPDHPCHRYALHMSLRDFCVHPLTRHMVENYQSCYLAKAPCHPATVMKYLTAERLARLELAQRMEYPDPTHDPDVLLRRAKERLTRFVAIGFAEDYRSSLLRISDCLNLAEPQVFDSRNVSPERLRVAEVDSDTVSLIRSLTEVDQQLYQFAKSHCRLAPTRV
jgi:Sulfotransferase family